MCRDVTCNVSTHITSLLFLWDSKFSLSSIHPTLQSPIERGMNASEPVECRLTNAERSEAREICNDETNKTLTNEASFLKLGTFRQYLRSWL